MPGQFVLWFSRVFGVSMWFMLDEPVDAEDAPFDLDLHQRTAVEQYRQVRGIYVDLAATVQALLLSALVPRGIKAHSVEGRSKSEESFGAKAGRASDADSNKPKYTVPLDQIHDLAGCRVITFFVDDVRRVREVIDAEFVVLEMANRSSSVREAGRPGYASYHFIVEMTEARLSLAEYARYRGRRIEIQVRTILQHAWAEIEHDIQYKSVDALPSEIAQRFTALAGMIEIADREFQAIATAHELVRRAAATSFAQGRLEDVELTPETLKAYLDSKLGPDGRMRDWSYEWTTRVVKWLGFFNLSQLDRAIEQYDDDQISRIVHGGRQGQLNRLEDVLLAAVGPERWLSRHPWAESSAEWYPAAVNRWAKKIADAGIPIGTFIP